MSKPRSLKFFLAGAIVVSLIGFVAGGWMGFRHYAQHRSSGAAVWPMFLAFAGLLLAVVSRRWSRRK